jgi:hypothetical protein
MKPNDLLTLTSVVSIVLLSVHVVDDIAHGFDSAGLVNFVGIVVLAGFLYATLIFRERLAGRIVMLLVALFALGMPLIHLRSVRINEIAQASGGMFFIWTLWALGITGILGLILAVQEFLSRRSRTKRATPPTESEGESRRA